jgi:hypothetical protein
MESGPPICELFEQYRQWTKSEATPVSSLGKARYDIVYSPLSDITDEGDRSSVSVSGRSDSIRQGGPGGLYATSTPVSGISEFTVDSEEDGSSSAAFGSEADRSEESEDDAQVSEPDDQGTLKQVNLYPGVEAALRMDCERCSCDICTLFVQSAIASDDSKTFHSDPCAMVAFSHEAILRDDHFRIRWGTGDMEKEPALRARSLTWESWLYVNRGRQPGCTRKTETKFSPAHHFSFLPVDRGPECNTGSERSWRKAREWLNFCEANHDCTPDSKQDPLLPNRVLDLHSEDLQSVNLYETNGKRARYACLSHCWGSSQPLRTLRSNIDAHKRMIPNDVLPKTFRDAATVTKFFDIRYLWIDSLCIVQDDSEDWTKEAAQMASIYQNSTITLGASISRGANSGLFLKNRRERDRSLVSLTGNSMHNGIFLQKLREEKNHGLRRSKLMTRGWVVQERLLSPRFLHFGSYELILECMSRTTCECDPLEFESIVDFGIISLLPKDFLLHSKLRENDGAGWYLDNTWHQIVGRYTAMNLTFDKDIFTALSGVAKIVQSRMQSTYIAGMWEQHIIFDLAWNVEDPSGLTRRRREFSPTFSWAAIKRIEESDLDTDGLFIFWPADTSDWDAGDDLKLQYHCSVKDVSSVLAGPDPTGQCLSAHINLEGLRFPATLESSNAISSPVGDPDWYDRDFDRDPLHPRDNLPGASQIAKQFYPDYNFDNPGNYQLLPGSEVWCMPLFSFENWKMIEDQTYCLVLRETQDWDGGIGQFERIGLLCYSQILSEDWDRKRKPRAKRIKRTLARDSLIASPHTRKCTIRLT